MTTSTIKLFCMMTDKQAQACTRVLKVPILLILILTTVS